MTCFVIGRRGLNHGRCVQLLLCTPRCARQARAGHRQSSTAPHHRATLVSVHDLPETHRLARSLTIRAPSNISNPRLCEQVSECCCILDTRMMQFFRSAMRPVLDDQIEGFSIDRHQKLPPAPRIALDVHAPHRHSGPSLGIACSFALPPNDILHQVLLIG